MSTISMKPPGDCQQVPWAFLYALRESRLLSEEHWDKLQRQIDTLDMPAFTAALVEEGWLTLYQLRRILDNNVRGLFLGQYRILEELGEGGFGKVYKAVHALMNRPAAVKVISPKWTQSPAGRNLFLREVLATTRLTHPNVAVVYEANQSDSALWFAMEYVDGPTLDDLVAERGPLPVPFACAVMLQVAGALQAAHENGMVHRDVKPANLLMPGDGPDSERPLFPSGPPPVLVKVVDFGLARLLSTTDPQPSSICQDGVCVGTPEFMSPEQARNSHQVDIRSDLYSLGCTFYFALTGRPPFRGATEVETITQHFENEPESLALLRPDAPSSVVEIVRRLMAKEPGLRYPDPAALAESLKYAIGDLYREKFSGAAGRPARVPSRLLSAEIPAVAAAPEAAPQPAADGRMKDPPLALWAEWLGVVAALARETACDWSEEEYAALYGSLMGRLHDLARPASPRSEVYARAESLVEPWLKMRALANLDRKMRIELWQTARKLDAELSPAPRFSLRTYFTLLGMLAGAALMAAGFLFLGGK